MSRARSTSSKKSRGSTGWINFRRGCPRRSSQPRDWNLNHGQRNVRLFEFGKTYRWAGAEPLEIRMLTLGATGLAREKGVAETEREYVFADLKGDLDQIGHLAGGIKWKGKGMPSWLDAAHAGALCLTWVVDIGAAGQLS